MSENYALARLKRIGFDPTRDFGILDTYSGEVNFKVTKKDRMWSDDEGNLCIGIVDLENKFITSAPKTTGKASREILHVKRLANPDTDGGKYRPGKTGQGVFPCLWPFLLNSVKKKTKIKTLVITEGYLKAYALDKYEILAIGIPGITVWKEKNQQDAFKAIRDVVCACEVENIIWLTDGDTMKVEWSESKDLSKRPFSFFTSVRLFKEKTHDLEITQFWYHIRDEIVYKGIDDLLEAEPKKVLQIAKELNKPGSTDSTFFKRFNVSAMTFEKLREYFGIHDGANGFYKKYEDKIGLRPFLYGKGLYQWNEETRTLDYIRAGESAQFIMVDSTYYIKGPMPTVHGTVENILKPTKITAIQKMFQHKTKAELARILYDIPHYNGFINRPSHTDYKLVWEQTDPETNNTMKYYNMYHQLSHKPHKGSIDLSMQFVKHVFGTGTVEYEGKSYNEYDLGLDYLQLLYTNPTQKLHILCLVSEKGSTGKTTFWEWIAFMFQQNVREIASDQLTGQFTTFFAACLLCYMDEAFIDRIHVVEKLKQLVTAAKARFEGKFEHADTIDSFLKIGLSSNNVKNFASIRLEEMRFWIRVLNEIPKDLYDAFFKNKLYAEVPAFLHFLQNRQLVTEPKSRFWFANELVETEALEIVKKESRSSIEISLEMCLREYISNCNVSVVKLSPSDFKEILDESTMTLAKIRWGMQRFNIDITRYSNEYKYYKMTRVGELGIHEIMIINKKSTTYKILASTFFTPEECVEMFDQEELLILEKEEIKSGCESWFNKLQDKKILLKPEESAHPDYLYAISKSDSYKTFLEVTNRLKLPF